MAKVINNLSKEKHLEKKIKALELALSESKKEILTIKRLVESLSATVVGELKKPSVIGSISEYDDTEIRKLIDNIEIPERYDDTALKSAIKAMNIPKAYDDTEIRKLIERVELLVKTTRKECVGLIENKLNGTE